MNMLKRTGFARKTYTPAPAAPLRRLERAVMYAGASDVVAVPKREYIRSKALLAAVRTLPCMVTGVEGRTEPAHSNWQDIGGKGRGVKADDNRVAAMSVEIHRELDQGKKWTYAERRAIWFAAHVKTVRELLRRGLWPANVPVPDIRSFDA